jgi:anaphase-promoting complex subunit 10
MQDLKEVLYVDLRDPQGWYIFPLRAKQLNGTERPYIATMHLQIAILQNLHSGKDTHIRQVKVFGPK